MNSGNVQVFPDYEGYEKLKDKKAEASRTIHEDNYNQLIKEYLEYLTAGLAKNKFGLMFGKKLKI